MEDGSWGIRNWELGVRQKVEGVRLGTFGLRLRTWGFRLCPAVVGGRLTVIVSKMWITLGIVEDSPPFGIAKDMLRC